MFELIQRGLAEESSSTNIMVRELAIWKYFCQLAN